MPRALPQGGSKQFWGSVPQAVLQGGSVKGNFLGVRAAGPCRRVASCEAVRAALQWRGSHCGASRGNPARTQLIVFTRIYCLRACCLMFKLCFCKFFEQFKIFCARLSAHALTA